MCIYIYIHTYMYMYTYIYIYIHLPLSMYIYIYIYTHVIATSSRLHRGRRAGGRRRGGPRGLQGEAVLMYLKEVLLDKNLLCEEFRGKYFCTRTCYMRNSPEDFRGKHLTLLSALLLLLLIIIIIISSSFHHH